MGDGSTIAMFARLLVSLGVVIGLMWGIAVLLRKRGLAPAARRNGREAEVELIARRALGRNASIYIVRAGGHGMVLGVTDHMVTKLADADLTEIELEDMGVHENGGQWTAPDAGTSSPDSAWKTMLGQVRDRTVRR